MPSQGTLRFLACVYLFCAPIESLVLPIVGTPVRLAGAIFVGYWLLSIVVAGRRPQLPIGIKLLAGVMVGWALLSTVWAVDPWASELGAVTLTGLTLSAVAIADVMRDESRIPAKWIALGSVVSAVPLYFLAADAARAGRTSYEGIDENILAFHLCLGLAACCYLILTKHDGFAAVVWPLLASGVCIGGVLLTGSRTGFGSAIGVLAASLLVSMAKPKATLIAAVGALFAFGVFQYFAASGRIPLRVEGWLSAPSVIDSRTSIIDAYLSSQDYWFFKGVGYGNDSQYLTVAAGNVMDAHNGFWRIFVELGIVGVVMYALLLLNVIKYTLTAPMRLYVLLTVPAVVFFMWTLGPNESNALWAVIGLGLAGWYHSSRQVTTT